MITAKIQKNAYTLVSIKQFPLHLEKQDNLGNISTKFQSLNKNY